MDELIDRATKAYESANVSLPQGTDQTIAIGLVLTAAIMDMTRAVKECGNRIDRVADQIKEQSRRH
jgi:hypothetical protein